MAIDHQTESIGKENHLAKNISEKAAIYILFINFLSSEQTQRQTTQKDKQFQKQKENKFQRRLVLTLRDWGMEKVKKAK